MVHSTEPQMGQFREANARRERGRALNSALYDYYRRKATRLEYAMDRVHAIVCGEDDDKIKVNLLLEALIDHYEGRIPSAQARRLVVDTSGPRQRVLPGRGAGLNAPEECSPLPAGGQPLSSP